MPPTTRSQAQRQRESEDHDMDDPPATPPSTPSSTPSDESNDDSSERRYREYTPDNMSDDREASPTRALVIRRLLEPGVPPKEKPCAICKDDFPEPTADCPYPAVRLPCNHYFCEECITHWLMDPWFDTCPCCRHVVIKYEPGTGLPESEDGEDENDPQQENTAPPAQNTALALPPDGPERIVALQREIFIRDEEIRLYNNAIRQAQQAPASRAPLRDITDAHEFRERPNNEENRQPQRMPLGELTNGSPTRNNPFQDAPRDAQRHQAIRDAERARANRANRINRVSLFQEHRNGGGGGGPIRGRHPLQDVTNASSPIQRSSPAFAGFDDIQPQQSGRGRTPVQAIPRTTTPSTPGGRSRLNRSRSPSRDLTDPRSYRARRAPIQLPQLRLPPGQLRALTPSDHGRRRASNRSAASSSIYTLAPSEPLSTGETVFTLAPEFPQVPQAPPTPAAAANDGVDAMIRSDARPGFFDAEALIPDRFARRRRRRRRRGELPNPDPELDSDSDSDSDDDDSDAETAGRRTPRAQPAAGSNVRRLLWSSRTSPTPTNPPRSVTPNLAPNLNATWTPLQGQTLTARISVARIRDQRQLLLNAIRFGGRGQAEEAFRAMVRVAEQQYDDGTVVAVAPLFRAFEQAGRDELVALARGQESGVANRMNSPLRRRRIYGGGDAGQVLRPEILDAVRRLARRVVNLLRG
ncbi:RING finger protein 151 [Lasiodiplodia hormozganensis]|uniref:RING finger protein 151 n=1 Tax=Lasiodiplodia hormozganensis TaxID=869390 RepID=A0AA39WV55_9PEZI|nr:RING finger protein 151 [Lasiodiplodia hormozganensis]